jgi:hypothetical protein
MIAADAIAEQLEDIGQASTSIWFCPAAKADLVAAAALVEVLARIEEEAEDTRAEEGAAS